MNNSQTIRDVQEKILEIMKFIDALCRRYEIIYYIMGGTALGAVRHGGFIPWDDDLDIFMTPDQYKKFKKAFEEEKNDLFVLQEWKTTPDYLEYAKVRMNGTTFIEEQFKDRKDMHQGIYVDIMILHKVPDNRFIQKVIYLESKFVTLYALSQRNWRPKSRFQMMMLKMLKFMPCKAMVRLCYKGIYKYDNLRDGFQYCYWITPGKFRNGLFPKSFFEKVEDIAFENIKLRGSNRIKEYLKHRYGDYMQLPSRDEQRAAVHAMFVDVNKDYTEYLKS